MRKSLTYSDSLNSEGKTGCYLINFKTISCDLGSENMLFTCVWKVQSSRKFFYEDEESTFQYVV